MQLEIAKVLKLLKKSFKNPFFGLLGLSFVLICLLWLGSFASEKDALLTSSSANQFLNSPFISQGDISYLESPDLSLVQGSALRAVSAPTTLAPKVLGALIGSQLDFGVNKEIVEYTVESGDTLWSIAESFDISLETILWANSLNKSSIIQPGKKLIILPVSGIIHHVAKGDTIGAIAERYKSKTDEIISFNDLSSGGEIFISDILVIPNGIMPVIKTRIALRLAPLAQSYFICPISAPCRVTQGLHWYNAIDFSHGECSEPIYAAAEGTVLKVKTTSSTSRWAFGGAGNHLTILHPNGVVTFYGHIQKSLVNVGQNVSQGQLIALVGGRPGSAGAGKSTGCHLHFGVTGARNPFSR